MAAEYAKCSGCKCLRHIVDEYEVYKGTRRKTCLKCKESRNKNKCKHGKVKNQCKECGGSRICEHGKIKSYCKECGGSAFCKHGRDKRRCKECGGSSICEHGKRKEICRDCGGSAICQHGIHKNICKDCDGSLICEHGKQKKRCKECDPSGHLRSIVYERVRRALKSGTSKKTLEYLGCTIEQFKEHIGFQFKTGMNWDNYGEVWHIDHIISLKFKENGQEPSLEDTIKRLHWTNAQPLFKS